MEEIREELTEDFSQDSRQDINLNIEDLEKQIRYMKSRLEDMKDLEKRISNIEMQINRRRNPFMQKR